MFKNKQSLLDYGLALALILVGVSFRFLPHAPNFTPIIALALFGGAYLSKKLAVVVPLGAMLVSDLFIGSYEIGLMIVVYGSLLLIVGVGFSLKGKDNWYKIGIASMVGAVLFFLATNLGVWALTPWYEKTWAGLLRCYYFALPFFRNSMISTLVYSTALFFSYKTIKAWLTENLLKYDLSDHNQNFE